MRPILASPLCHCATVSVLRTMFSSESADTAIRSALPVSDQNLRKQRYLPLFRRLGVGNCSGHLRQVFKQDLAKVQVAMTVSPKCPHMVRESQP